MLLTGEVQYFEFDSFGNLQSATGSLTLGALPTIWAGHQLDEGTGYYHAQWRWYDPETGQFLSQDPILDDNNAYRYAGNDPVNNVDPTGLADVEFKALTLASEAVEFWMDATGDRKSDRLAANRSAKEASRLKGFVSGRNMGGVWHHAKFDAKEGKFLMQLVDKSVHEATSHTGAFSKYLDWVSSTLDAGELKNLNSKQASLLKKALGSHELMNPKKGQLYSRLQKIGMTVERVGSDLHVLKDGVRYLDILRSSSRGRWATAILQRGGAIAKKGIPIVSAAFIFSAASNAKAAGGSNMDAAKAAMRELVSADLVEDAYEMTVVSGTDAVYRHFVNGPSKKQRQLLENMTLNERRHVAELYGWTLEEQNRE